MLIHYFYNFSANVATENFIFINEHQTVTDLTLNGDSVFLDRQTFTCPPGEYLSEFNPINNNGQFQYNYKCVKFASTYNALTDCTTKDTGFNDIGNSLIFLDRHRMSCDVGQAITGFKGTSIWPSGRFMFTYTCCKGFVLYPSTAPTLAPVADPTEAPISNPTLAPTLAPVADPTAAPSKLPTYDPTLKPVAKVNIFLTIFI